MHFHVACCTFLVPTCLSQKKDDCPRWLKDFLEVTSSIFPETDACFDGQVATAVLSRTVKAPMPSLWIRESSGAALVTAVGYASSRCAVEPHCLPRLAGYVVQGMSRPHGFPVNVASQFGANWTETLGADPTTESS